MNITNNFVTMIYFGMGICVALCSAMHILYFALTTHDLFKKRDAAYDAKLEQIRDELIAEIKTSGERSSDLVVGGITQMTQESIMAQTQTAKELNVNLINAIDRYTQTTAHIIESKKRNVMSTTANIITCVNRKGYLHSSFRKDSPVWLIALKNYA